LPLYDISSNSNTMADPKYVAIHWRNKRDGTLLERPPAQSPDGVVAASRALLTCTTLDVAGEHASARRRSEI
jgi:hypothetical protein